MRILIVEDDYLQAEWLQTILKERIKGVETERIKSEHEFRCQLERLRADPPDVIVIDVMLRWTDPDSRVPPSMDVSEGGFYRAGLRCEKLLRDAAETRDVRVILYTMLELKDLEQDLAQISPRSHYIGKSSDTGQLLDYLMQ